MSTLFPSFSPTLAPTLIGDSVPSTLVLGIGAGTFTIIVLSVVLALIWGFSAFCQLKKKIIWRLLSTLLYGVVFVILVFSPRDSKYPFQDTEVTEIYDDSIIPRIAITSVTCLFALIAAVIVLVHTTEQKQLSTTQPDLSSFWMEE